VHRLPACITTTIHSSTACFQLQLIISVEKLLPFISVKRFEPSTQGNNAVADAAEFWKNRTILP
jgi:hypothetical protein